MGKQLKKRAKKRKAKLSSKQIGNKPLKVSFKAKINHSVEGEARSDEEK
jgi:hypothetical protein